MFVCVVSYLSFWMLLGEVPQFVFLIVGLFLFCSILTCFDCVGFVYGLLGYL